MNGRRVNVMSFAVGFAVVLVALGSAAWAYATVTASPHTRPAVAQFDPLPSAPVTTTPTTAPPVVQSPVPEPAALPASEPPPRRHAAVPAPVTTTTTTQPVVLIPPETVEKPTCPSDGTTFPYGSCTLPAGVHDSGADLAPNGQPVAQPGALSKIVTLCDALVLRPASYEQPPGAYDCHTEVGQ